MRRSPLFLVLLAAAMGSAGCQEPEPVFDFLSIAPLRINGQPQRSQLVELPFGEPAVFDARESFVGGTAPFKVEWRHVFDWSLLGQGEVFCFLPTRETPAFWPLMLVVTDARDVPVYLLVKVYFVHTRVWTFFLRGDTINI